jgi:hypothetical protein
MEEPSIVVVVQAGYTTLKSAVTISASEVFQVCTRLL